MSKARSFALTFFIIACGGCEGDDDSGNGSPNRDAAPAECVHSPYNGLEPACAFEPGPGNGLSEPAADALPKPTGVCPGFADGAGCRAETTGALTCTFQPAGQPEREVRVWMPPADRSGPGPLIFYYYGLLGSPQNAVTPIAGFTAEALELLTSAGGMLVAPQARPDRLPPKLSRLPWIGALGLEDDPGDFLLVDEVVGCAMEKIGIDVGRIHVTGLSAGAWMTAQVAVQRSSYVASVALFSGGLETWKPQDPDNKYAVAMFHGGPGDYVGAHFENEAQSGVNLWRTQGHFAVSCNHQGGHTVPAAAALAGMQFLLDHRYGTLRSPYCQSAPAELGACSLTTAATGGVLPASGRPEGEVASCLDSAAVMGLTGGSLTDDMLTCACERCGAELEACLADLNCVAGMQCAAQKGCLGISCYQDPICAPVIDAAGGALAESPQRAVAFSDCVGAASCARCGGPKGP